MGNAFMCRLCLPSWEFWFSQEQSGDGTLTSIGKWTARSRQQDSFACVVFLLFLFLFFSRASCFTKINININLICQTEYKTQCVLLLLPFSSQCGDFLSTQFFGRGQVPLSLYPLRHKQSICLFPEPATETLILFSVPQLKKAFKYSIPNISDTLVFPLLLVV